jgi:hypothetical protein
MISQRMKKSNILVKFGSDQNVIQDHYDNESFEINYFKIQTR